MRWQRVANTIGGPAMRRRPGRIMAACAAAALVVTACGGDDDDVSDTTAAEATDPTSADETSADETTADDTTADVTTADEGTPAPSSEGTTTPDEAPGELTEITIGFPQLAHTAAIPLAIEQGFFADEGLEVTLNSTIANPAIPAAVVSGDLQAGVTGWSSVANFAIQGLPVKVAVGLSALGDAGEGADGGLTLVSLADGGITSASELAGKTVLMNSLGADPEATARTLAQNAGVDPDSINFQAVDLPEIPAALKAGRADAVVISEPFLTQLEADTELNILGSASDMQPGRPGLNLVVANDYAEQHPEIVAALQRAMARAAEFANENPDAVRAVLVETFGFAPEVAEQVALPVFVAFPDADTIQQVPQALADVGLLEEVPDMSTMVLAPPSDLGSE